jgi:hypothetical protein
MVYYKKTNVTAKKGINFVRSVVESAGSIFHKIDTENDLGIDAIIELIRDEKPLNSQLAVQIKSGASYYNAGKDECMIPIDNHRDYWLNHPLPVIGIVYIPSTKQAFWIDIKSYLKKHSNESIIVFSCSETKLFDEINFLQLFVPAARREIPKLKLNESVRLFKSQKPDEAYLGLISLFRNYPNNYETWMEIIEAFKNRSIDQIPEIMIYFLAHIPWHGDILYHGKMITKETQNFANQLFAKFGEKEVIKLLLFIDDDNGIARGTLGQSVEAIVTSLPDSKKILSEIIKNNNYDNSIREFAAFILAMQIGIDSIPIINHLIQSGSSYAQEIVKHLNRYGGLTPYS